MDLHHFLHQRECLGLSHAFSEAVRKLIAAELNNACLGIGFALARPPFRWMDKSQVVYLFESITLSCQSYSQSPALNRKLG